ncbi:MAG: hypothetical protein ACFFC6_12350 [Promethearchaeota archaeon]
MDYINLNNGDLVKKLIISDHSTEDYGVIFVDDEELVVDTPWGKLVTSRGLKYLLTGFQQDLERLGGSLARIETRINEIESTQSIDNVKSRIQAIEGSLKSLEDEIQKFRDNQTAFAAHMKKTLQIFYSKLDQEG